MARSSGTAYLTRPDAGTGPGVLVLHSWWGLTPFFRQLCDRLAADGFVALAPDLFGGVVIDDPAEARERLAGADMNAMVHLVRSSLLTLRDLPITPDAPVGTLGFSMGASWALWLASRVPDVVGATVVFYGAQNVDMAAATSPFLGHFAADDDVIDHDELVLLEADLRLLDKDVTFHHYPGTGHWFFEDDRPAYDAAAAALAWERTTEFLHRHLGGDPAAGEAGADAETGAREAQDDPGAGGADTETGAREADDDAGQRSGDRPGR